MVRPPADVESNNIFPFGRLETIDFARFVIVEASLTSEVKHRTLEPPLLLFSTMAGGGTWSELRASFPSYQLGV